MSFNALIKARDQHAQDSRGGWQGEGASSPRADDRLICCHDFQYPGLRFRVSLFAGRMIPQAATLVREAYSRLGYRFRDGGAATAAARPPTAALQATTIATTLGTLSVNLDERDGLRAEALYPTEVSEFRQRARLCEFTQLALDTALAGREVLCSLFYVAYVFSHLVHKANGLFVEVNPRHRCFYERMLGFRQVGEERICARVAAPAVLLYLDFDFTRLQIERSRLGLSVAGTTLYRYAPPLGEERLLIERMSDPLRR